VYYKNERCINTLTFTFYLLLYDIIIAVLSIHLSVHSFVTLWFCIETA